MTARRREPVRPNATPRSVINDGKRIGQLWGRYVSRAGAAAMACMLRARGLGGVRVVGPKLELKGAT
jgi:hypothetical protein